VDLQGNEGLVAAAAAPAPGGLLQQVQAATASSGKLPSSGNELVVQVMRSLWRFLHDTGHPQVKGTSPEDVSFQIMDKVTIRKMENALMKILLLGVETAEERTPVRPVTANLAFAALLHAEAQQGDAMDIPTSTSRDLATTQPTPVGASGMKKPAAGTGGYAQTQPAQAQKPQRAEVRDPFSDLKAAFEPPKEKLRTFNLKQIVTRNGTVLMNMLERVLETTEIDARDVETEQTLLEYACREGNMSLAKLCYRRGANLSGKTKRGETPFTIVTKTKRYDLMEFLHLYGVKVNSGDADGMTALHFAAQNDDLDGICRLIEWGADVNIKDNRKRTPIHMAAMNGNTKATMLLLEVGADMNAKDDKEFTAAAHANAKSHFALFDRLTLLGGKRHGLHNSNSNQAGSTKKVGELVVTAGMLKSSSLGRIGKVAVEGMPPPIQPFNLNQGKKPAAAAS
jgi:ankyrin repeat protein